MAKNTKIDLFGSEKDAASKGPVKCLGMTFPNDEARRTYFLEKLREKLKDPAFRKIDGFPIGDDEDILALSDPPYYTACPNPFILNFISTKQSSDDGKEYHREPFATDVSEGRSGTVYDAHTYHTKVPHKAIMKYILHYTDPGAVILDTFAGTGMAGVAAALCEHADSELESYEGIPGRRNAIISDLSPAATQIAAGYCSNVDAGTFVAAATDLLSRTEKEIGWVYQTRGEKGDPEQLIYTIWSDVLGCNHCGGEIIFWDAAYDTLQVCIREQFSCPHCGVEVSKRTSQRMNETVFDTFLQKTLTIPKQVPVLMSVKGAAGRYERVPNAHDYDLLRRIERTIAAIPAHDL